ncbi:hypothetical protein E2542_SST07281 [Spatholobus suberectus]|nr:hypothetical protein E2542_SST07281 [Spatholobus suberectus]
MEQKNILLSALGVGVGVGVGIGLASGQGVTKWGANENSSSNGVTPENMEHEMLRLVVDGRESKVTFDQFPYYLREQTRVLLTSAAYVHLKHAEVSKYTRNLAPASRTILLSGPAELYQQVLAKALAHYFEAKLLLLDLTDFPLKVSEKFCCHLILSQFSLKSFKRSTSESTLERISDLFGSFSIFPPKEEPKVILYLNFYFFFCREGEGSCNPPKHRRNASASANINSLALQNNPTNSGCFKKTFKNQLELLREEGAVIKTETKSENPAPDIKAEADASTSVGKSDSENSVPASKAEKKQKGAEGQNNNVQDVQGNQSTVGNTQDALDAEEEVQQERVITLRPLNMQDFKEAKNQLGSSCIEPFLSFGFPLVEWHHTPFWDPFPLQINIINMPNKIKKMCDRAMKAVKEGGNVIALTSE